MQAPLGSEQFLESLVNVSDNSALNIAMKSDIPTKVGELKNDMEYLSAVDDVNTVLTLRRFGVTFEGDIPTKVSQLENDKNYGVWEDVMSIIYGNNFVSDGNYIHTDNNFTDELKAKLESCHIFSANYDCFLGDLMGLMQNNAFNIEKFSTKTYVDEQLGVIENGSY